MIKSNKDLVSIISGFSGLLSAIIGILISLIEIEGKNNALPLFITASILVGVSLYIQWDRFIFVIVYPIARFFEKIQGYLPFIFLGVVILFFFIIWVLMGQPTYDDIDEITGGKLERWEHPIASINILLSLILVISIYSLSIRYRGLLLRNATKYVGTFPDNMKEIIQLIDSTKKELLIAVDFPSYGSFSAPEMNDMYQQAIINLAKNKDVKLILVIYNDEKAREASRIQFNHIDWGELKNSKSFKKFNEYYAGLPNPESMEELIQRFIDLDKKFIKSLEEKRSEIISHTKINLPAYFWISDNEKAIFSFYNLEGQSSEVSFYTKDFKLISVLKTIFYRIG